jgi:hypothetical protein
MAQGDASLASLRARSPRLTYAAKAESKRDSVPGREAQMRQLVAGLTCAIVFISAVGIAQAGALTKPRAKRAALAELTRSTARQAKRSGWQVSHRRVVACKRLRSGRRAFDCRATAVITVPPDQVGLRDGPYGTPTRPGGSSTVTCVFEIAVFPSHLPGSHGISVAVFVARCFEGAPPPAVLIPSG